jgi:hypothetical protein
VELLDVTGRLLVAEAACDLWSKSADGVALAGRLVVEVGWRHAMAGRLVVEVSWRRCNGRATCGRSRLAALQWPGDLWSRSSDGVAMAGRHVVEVV